MKKILVIDGNSIINRAYYGVRPLTTKSGKHTNAIFGMINIISRQISALSPDYAAVAFDLKAPTFRHEMYPEYKAGRHPTPPELLSQFDDAKECLGLMGLHVLELPGYEADDLQGTVAKMADGKETESYVLSGDRDLLQLIDDKTTVLLATNTETRVMGRCEFSAEYGISPEAFVDMKALMGDSSDNIPGVAGVGKKTAESLIQNFGSLDGVYANIEDGRISKGVREKLLRDKENAYLSRRLAEINTHAPLPLSLEDLKYEGPDKAGLYKKFSELELNSFIVKFGLKGADGEGDNRSRPERARAEYEKIPATELAKIIKDPVSIQVLQTNIYINTNSQSFELEGELSELEKILEGRDLITYGAKALIHTLWGAGVSTAGTHFLDLALYAYCLNPGSGESGVYPLITMFLGESADVGTPCVDLYPELEGVMRKKVEDDGLSRVLFDVELPLIPVLAEVEARGFKIDASGIKEFGAALTSLADELTQRIYMQAGREFNINSPKQLGEVLFVDLGLVTKKKKTKTGYSTDAETLEELRAQSPVIDDILEYRQVTKLYNTYCAVLPEVADERHRVHTDFKQAHTATGRLSSADPNLQNIPIRTKLGRELRRYFIAEDGYTLVDADYSQIELRLLAHIADDYTMREAFVSGEDIHTKTAAAVFGVPESDVTSDMRSRAKAVNFGIVYGISGYSLSEDIGTSVAEATRYIKNYLMNYPSVDSYLERVVKEARERGYTETILGRRRYIPELSSSNAAMRAFGSRVAMNAPIQGSAADVMKLAMIKVHRRLIDEGLDARIVMQVHDELVVEAHLSVSERVKKILSEEMEGAISVSVPLTVDVTSGKNWLEQE